MRHQLHAFMVNIEALNQGSATPGQACTPLVGTQRDSQRHMGDGEQLLFLRVFLAVSSDAEQPLVVVECVFHCVTDSNAPFWL